MNSATDKPLVSILVAAWNAGDLLHRHIRSFQALRYPALELVLCAGGDDQTLQRAKAYQDQRIRIVPQLAGDGKQRALRRAFPFTSGSIIYLTDIDCVLDDECFEQVIRPILTQTEVACSGLSKPTRRQLSNPFVALQAANQHVGNANLDRYVTGLRGCNCALTRDLIVQSQGLMADARAGTDYVLAKMVVRSGARIRHVTGSHIQTEYPDTARAYVRQQRRWLRNLIWHGKRFGALDEVRQAVRTSLIGILMLLLPPASLFMPPLLAVWLGVFVYTCGARVRYLREGGHALNTIPQQQHYILIPVHILLDFCAWSLALIDCVSAEKRAHW